MKVILRQALIAVYVAGDAKRSGPSWRGAAGFLSLQWNRIEGQSVALKTPHNRPLG